MTHNDMNHHSYPSPIHLNDDGESGRIEQLDFRSRALHRLLAEVEDGQRSLVVADALAQGAELLARASHHGGLQQFATAVERLDGESSRIVVTATERFERIVEAALAGMAASLQGDDGPLAPVLDRFDPSTDGNVIDLFRDTISVTLAKATKAAVKELTDTTKDTMEVLAKSVATLDKVAAAEQARLIEAARGTAKGLEHEDRIESLLGELVAVGGDSLDDVSTVVGLAGSKKGDKIIVPRGGMPIVTEEKCTKRLSESAARALLEESMANRGAELAMLIVEDESKVPGHQPYYLIDDDKVVVTADRSTMRLVYTLFRAKSIELAKAAYTTDEDAIADVVGEIHRHVVDIKDNLDRFKLLRTEHTKAAKAIGQAQTYVDQMADGIADSVAGIMASIENLVDDDSGQAAA